MIVIVDYGAGNLASIPNMLRRCGVEAVVSGDAAVIRDASKIILPGVGAFDHGMAQLEKSGVIPALEDQVRSNGVPLLGICLGFQLLSRRSEEGERDGLGWIAADTVRFDLSSVERRLPIPHMGWNEVDVTKDSSLFREMPEEPRFYFVHEYHVTCDDDDDVLAKADYGIRFHAGAERDNVAAVQFHPEKSHKFGMRLLDNFCSNN